MNCSCSEPVPKTKHNRICDLCGRNIKQISSANELLSSRWMMQAVLNDWYTRRADYMTMFPKETVKKITYRQKLARKIKEMRRRMRNTEAALKGSWEADDDY